MTNPSDKNVLLVSIAFSPNIGGIETHFDNLVFVLTKKDWKVDVLTYKPITTNIPVKIHEKRGKNINIYRIPWIKGFFYKLLKKPILEFVYLVPGLFFALPFFLLFKGRNIKVIHSHGLVAGFVSVFWGKVFGKRVIITTHSIYNFPRKGLYRNFAEWIFKMSEVVLCLSKQSRSEIEKLGINKTKVKVFTYWVDLEKFKPIKNAKQKLGWKNEFVVLFVGRLVKEKGVLVLLEAIKKWNKNIYLAIAGIGPLESNVKSQMSKVKNIIYLGKIDNNKLPVYYSAADLVIVPSIHEEGFGRVILESLACGTPVIGSNRGAIPEAMNETVGELIEVTKDSIIRVVDNIFTNSKKLSQYQKNARKYALEKYSETNVDVIIKEYEAS